jgi:hypothetical protein
MSHTIVNVVRHVLLSETRYGRPPTVSRICAITGMARTVVQRCLVIIEAQNWTRP